MTISLMFGTLAKMLKKKLAAASKKKSCAALGKWIKSIINHFWWSCATCEENEELLREKWTSIVFHIKNKHSWSGNSLYHRCMHPELSLSEEHAKEWLLPTSESFKALQLIVFDKTTLNDLKHLTKFSHTGSLEVYHSLYNKWLPKSHHFFSYNGMIARSQLAALDFNLGSELQQARTKDGDNRFNVSFSKITQSWSAKPIKEGKDRTVFHQMVGRTLDVVCERLVLPVPVVPNLPKNIAPIAKPPKEEIVQ